MCGIIRRDIGFRTAGFKNNGKIIVAAGRSADFLSRNRAYPSRFSGMDFEVLIYFPDGGS